MEIKTYKTLMNKIENLKEAFYEEETKAEETTIMASISAAIEELKVNRDNMANISLESLNEKISNASTSEEFRKLKAVLNEKRIYEKNSDKIDFLVENGAFEEPEKDRTIVARKFKNVIVGAGILVVGFGTMFFGSKLVDKIKKAPVDKEPTTEYNVENNEIEETINNETDDYYNQNDDVINDFEDENNNQNISNDNNNQNDINQNDNNNKSNKENNNKKNKKDNKNKKQDDNSNQKQDDNNKKQDDNNNQKQDDTSSTKKEESTTENKKKTTTTTEVQKETTEQAPEEIKSEENKPKPAPEDNTPYPGETNIIIDEDNVDKNAPIEEDEKDVKYYKEDTTTKKPSTTETKPSTTEKEKDNYDLPIEEDEEDVIIYGASNKSLKLTIPRKYFM